jgi:glutamate carboxypeptidase
MHTPPHSTIAQAENLIEAFLVDLETIVNIDSGTYTKAGIDRVVTYLQQRFLNFGFSTRIEPQEKYGNNLIATHIGNAPEGPRLLLIGHTDTVFPDGEATRRPFSLSEREGMRTAKGPGVLDMKSGLLLGIYALHMLIDADKANYQRVTFVLNSDEEIGSPGSKPLIEAQAREADAVIVLEPGRQIDRVVSSRRGTAHYTVEVRGVAAHAGVEPQKGRSAILELAHQIVALQGLNGKIPGTTLNVGIIQGGERINIVPDSASCDIDVRASSRAGAEEMEAAMRKVTAQTTVDDTSVTLSGGVRALPFECTERSSQLVHLAREAGRDLGLEIEDVSSGGASDANTTAGMGVPTIDGLGTGGGLAHNPDEYVELDYLPTRIAFAAGLIQRIGEHYASGKRL